MAKKAGQPAAEAKPKAQPKTKAIKNKPKNSKARLDISKLKVGNHLSYVSYYHVSAIHGGNVMVNDQNGDIKTVSKEILEKWPSATHF